MSTLAFTLTMAVAGWPGASPDRPLARYEFTQIQMGMPFKLVLYAREDDTANAAASAVYARIRQLNASFSDYEPDSELMRVCRTAGSGKPVPVGRDLFEVLKRAQALSSASDGAFDVTVGPVVRLWRESRRSKQLPDAAQLSLARKAVGYRNVRLDHKMSAVELTTPGMQLDLGGIAVGYAIDQALEVLAKRGIDSALVDGSGDIGVSGPPPGSSGWRIGIAPDEADGEPTLHVVLRHAAITTSGDAYQFVEIEGTRYSHIVDPATGVGLTDRSSVTVIASDCTTADSFATAVAVMGPSRGLKLIEETCGAAALIVRKPADKVETFESKRFRAYVEKRP